MEKTNSVCAEICRVPWRKPGLVVFCFFGFFLVMVGLSSWFSVANPFTMTDTHRHKHTHMQILTHTNPHEFSLMGRNLVINILAVLKPL